MLLEDDLVTSVALGKQLRTGMPDLLVLNPHTLAEARLMLPEYMIDFFIVDINLPDGSGIDFISDLTTSNPAAGLVLITSTPLPEYRDRAGAYGVMHFLEKPVEVETLLNLIHEVRKAQAARPREDTALFQATLSHLTVLDIIQLKCLSNTTEAVVFKSKEHGSGLIYFENGDITHAETATKSGMEALSEIISWRTGRAQEMPGAPSAARTITCSWQSALLSAAHCADEKAGPPSEQPAEPALDQSAAEGVGDVPQPGPQHSPEDGTPQTPAR